VFTELDDLKFSLKEKHRALSGVPPQTLENYGVSRRRSVLEFLREFVDRGVPGN
jgi:hypothetical protein